MAEVISVASGVAGLITLAESLFDITFTYYKNVKHAQREISLLSSHMSLLSSTLYRLNLLTRRLESQSLDHVVKHEEIYNCQVLLEGIKKKISHSSATDNCKPNSLKRTAKKMVWPLTKSDVEALLIHIDQMKSTFDLALSAESMSAI